MRVTIEKQSDGTFIAYNVDGNATAMGVGASVSEAKKDFFNSLKELRETEKELGYPASDVCESENFEFIFDVSSLFEYYKAINVTAFAKSICINPSLMRQYKAGGTYVSKEQTKRIEDGLRALGRELAEINIL